MFFVVKMYNYYILNSVKVYYYIKDMKILIVKC